MGWSPFRKTGLSFHMSASFKGYTLVTPALHQKSPLDGIFMNNVDLYGLKNHQNGTKKSLMTCASDF